MTMMTENFFFLSNGVCSVDCPGSTGWLCAALLPVGYSQGLGGGSYSFLLSFRARLFYPANLFKRTFNSARPRVPSERRRRVVPRVQSTLFRRGLSNFSRLLRKFNVVVVQRDAQRDDWQKNGGRTESE